jgi:hypothetical protein
MSQPQPPRPTTFQSVKATLDGVTSAPFSTYHILTCIGLIATNHLLADHREHPRRIRLENRRARNEKWRREDEEDRRLDRKAKEIPHCSRVGEGTGSYREWYGGGPPPPYPYVLLPPRQARMYMPNLPEPSPGQPFPSSVPLQYPAPQYYRPPSPPPAFLYPRYGISKAYAEKLEARARGQWTRVGDLTAVKKEEAWEKMRNVRAVPIKVMNGRVEDEERERQKTVRWGRNSVREFVKEGE